MTLPISRGRKARNWAHEAESVEAHFAQVARTLVAFVDAGENLNLLANFGVGGKIGRFAAAAQPFGGFSFGGEGFGLHPFVHQPGGFLSDGRMELDIAHSL